MRTLRARLITLMVLLVIGAVVSLAVFSRHLSVTVVQQVQRESDVLALDALRTTVLAHFQDSGWRAVQQQLPELARMSGRELLVVDTAGNPLAAAPVALQPGDYHIDGTGALTQWQLALPATDSNGRVRLVRQRGLAADGGVPGILLLDRTGSRLGHLYSIPVHSAAEGPVPVASIYRPLALAFSVIALTAILIALLLSRRVLGPVEALTEAAMAMTRGDLEHRVVATGRDEIAALAFAFNSMADAVVRTQRLRREMTNDIAHELRTPLTNIRCTVESLADGVVTTSPAVLASLQEEVQLLQRLIDDLQDLALAEVGALCLHPEAIDLGHEVTISVRSMAREATACGVELTGQGEAGPVLADRERVQQILRNLIRNAITHTPSGGRVDVTVGLRGPASAGIAVTDTGSGIAPEHVHDIFERFYRVDPSRSRDTGGAGLGLAIVKSLAEAHGGRIEVHTVLGTGSEFLVVLPVAGPGPRAS